MGVGMEVGTWAASTSLSDAPDGLADSRRGTASASRRHHVPAHSTLLYAACCRGLGFRSTAQVGMVGAPMR